MSCESLATGLQRPFTKSDDTVSSAPADLAYLRVSLEFAAIYSVPTRLDETTRPHPRETFDGLDVSDSTADHVVLTPRRSRQVFEVSQFVQIPSAVESRLTIGANRHARRETGTAIDARVGSELARPC